MRPSILPISVIFLLAVCFSCTIEKRVHRPGYHIEWKKRFGKVEANEQKTIFSIPEEQPAETQQAEAFHEIVSETADSLVRFSDFRIQDTPTASDTPPFVWKRTGEERRLGRSLPGNTERSAVQKAVRKQHLDLDGLVALIITLLVVYVLIMLTCLIVGFLIVDTAPIWGAVLLVIGGWMLLGPIVAVVSTNIAERRKARRQPSPADPPKTVKTFASLPFAAKSFPGAQQHHAPSRSDLAGVALFVLLLFLVYIALAVMGIIFGISLIVMGTYFWGILLLVLGSFLLLFPPIVIAIADRQDKKEEEQKAAGKTSAFGLAADFVKPFRRVGFSRFGPLIKRIIRHFHKKKEQREAETAAFAPHQSGTKHRAAPSDGLARAIVGMFVLVLAVLAVCIVFGISFILAGSYLWGILLLAIAATIVLVPVILLISSAIRDRRMRRELERRMDERLRNQESGSFSQMTADEETPPEKSNYRRKKVLRETLGVLGTLVGVGLLTLGGIALLATFPFWGAFLIAIAGLAFAALIQWLLMLTGDRLEDALFVAYILTVFIGIVAAGVFAVGFCIALLAAGTIAWGLVLGIGGAI